MVAHACNLSYSGSWGEKIAGAQEFEAAVSYNGVPTWATEGDPISKKKWHSHEWDGLKDLNSNGSDYISKMQFKGRENVYLIH